VSTEKIFYIFWVVKFEITRYIPDMEADHSGTMLSEVFGGLLRFRTKRVQPQIILMAGHVRRQQFKNFQEVSFGQRPIYYNP
jgi:hypothetical protein